MQDTLQCVSQKVIEEDYSPKAMIDFSGKCKFIKPVEDKKQFDRFTHWLAAFGCQPKLYNF